MIFTLEQVLKLVGRLDDAPSEHAPRERFRDFLREHVGSAGDLRDFVQECRTKGVKAGATGDHAAQYSRALQDLVNHAGELLGFDVRYGRYAGVAGQVGFDGHWRSSEGRHVVVEVKTSETYPIKVSTLLDYIHKLVEMGDIPSVKDVLGLFVIARPDPEVSQVQNAIIVGGHAERLRIISVESLLSLAELLETRDVSHKHVLSVLHPGSPSVDPLVELLVRVAGPVSGDGISESPAATQGVTPGAGAATPGVGAGAATKNNGGQLTGGTTSPLLAGEVTSGGPTAAPTAGTAYHIVPAGDTEDRTASEWIEDLVGGPGVWAFSEKASGRRHLRDGDRVCLYAAGVGVVADARVAAAPAKVTQHAVIDAEHFPWVMSLDEVRIYTTAPIVLDAERRASLEAFQQASEKARAIWAWFVQSTHRVSAHDFAAITPAR